ncbi:MAG: hypothetical protein HYW57_07080 [Ignavibacteriales bacterium]|nr:hypothetical protein [Ignavibacteriales bacterium]
MKRGFSEGILWMVLTQQAILLPLYAQSNVEKEHRRGRLWEVVRNDGFIGSLGAWDYLTASPLGMFPAFSGFVHPFGNEFQAVNTYANANFHNFRSGVWIAVKDMLIPGGPPTYTPTPVPYEVYTSGLQEGSFGTANTLEPLLLKQNFIETSLFDPRLPEEMTEGSWYTNTGIRVTRRSYVWSYPGYSDFIIYDYIFRHTGEFIANSTRQLVPSPDPALTTQVLSEVYFVFHSGISVSTKSPLNFHCELFAVAAGAFGWQPATYHDYYHRFDNDELVFSTNYDGGKEPHPNSAVYCIKSNQAWKQKFGNEMFSPAAFGWLALYADPVTGQPARTSPAPDVLRIDSHKGGTFQGNPLDMETFRDPQNSGRTRFYTFATTPDSQAALGNNGNRFNFYSLSYGPYTLSPGDSVRIVLAEIAGVMDYGVVNAGDPDGWFPDSTTTAIRRNAALARNAVAWGRGANVNGMPLAADVPEPPPGPSTDAVNISVGSERAIIGVTWDQLAETKSIQDGSGAPFYGGLADLDGYRVYRSTDFQYASETEPPVFRGATWTLLADIPKTQFSQYWDPDLNRYRYDDSTVTFGFRYAYYVSAYNSAPGTWTSANGTTVTNLAELESGSYNRTEPTAAAPGPVTSFDVFVAPNPFVFGDLSRSFGVSDPYKIEFRNLPERCVIRIYTVVGDLIRTIRHGPDERGNLAGSRAWDQKSDSGLLVAPGLYVYHIESTTEGLAKSLTGKLMIIR